MTSHAPISLYGVWRRAPGVVSRQIAGENLLVPVKGNLADMQRIFTLNPTGAFVWCRLDGARNLEAVCAEVLGRFATTPEEAARDVLEFVGRLSAAGLAEDTGA